MKKPRKIWRRDKTLVCLTLLLGLLLTASPGHGGAVITTTTIKVLAGSEFQGSSSGKFLNPGPANAVVSGVGADTLDYGQPTKMSPCQLAFNSVEFDPVPGVDFTFGKLGFNNNPTIDGTEIDHIDLEFSLYFSNVPEKNITLTTPLEVMSTVNTGDYLQDADYISLLAGNAKYSFHVPEKGSCQVDILGKITSTPVITGLSQGKSSVLFGDLVSDTIFIFELTGFGNVYGDGFVTKQWLPGAPLPGTVGLLGLGLSLLALRARLQSKRA